VFKRAVSLLTAVACLVSSLSCSVHKSVPTSPRNLADDAGEFRVKGLVTTSGERMQFSGGSSARSEEGRLVVTRANTTFTIPKADIAHFERAGRGPAARLLLRNERIYVGEMVQVGDAFRMRASSVSIPMSQVDTVLVEKRDAGKVFLVTLAVVAGTIVGLYAISLALKESCPFVYSYDGQDYTLDGEPYGGATAPGLKRTDWGGLKYLRAVEGEYRFKLTNEVDETQYTDELKLLVVDHPRDVSVVADERGVAHSLRSPAAPSKAADARGRDILSYVNEDDWVYWQTQARDLDPQLASGAKERLVFEFPKPAGAKRARLVFDGGNTLWASRMVKEFLSLQGSNLELYYASLNTPGPSLFALQSWNMREELYRLNVRVSTPRGWVAKGSVAGGGPFVFRSKVYTLDIADVPGDVLKLELTPPVGFWMINHVAVDYGDDEALQVQELDATRAVDSRGTDVRPLLASTDGRYLAMPNTGDSADLVFAAPPPVSGLARTVILKTNGYYDIHMGKLGAPQSATLARIMGEPGFPVRFAMEAVAQWRADMAAAAAPSPR